VKKPREITQLVRGRLVARDERLVFEPHAAQGSMSITSLARLTAVALLPIGTSMAPAGTTVWVEPWGPVASDEESA